MRKPWIVIAMIALAAGLAAGYRMGRVGNPRSVSSPVERTEGAPPGGPAARAESGEREDAPASPESRQAAPAPAQPVEPVATGARPRDDDSSAPDSPKHSVAGARLPVTSVPGAPTVADGGRPSQAVSLGAEVSTPPGLPIHQPVPVPATPTASTGAQTNALPKEAAAPAPTPPLIPAPTPTPAPADDPESDRHPPVLLYLRFDPPEIRDGAVATLSVGVSDDLSGVKFVFGTVRSPSEAAIMPFSAQDEGGTGVFTSRIAIPQRAETGDWFVGSLQLVDKADNPLNLAFTKATIPPGGALRVSSDESDSTAPDVHHVAIEKGTVAAGESNQITVDVDDDRSGVASVTGTFQSPSRAAFIPFGCRQIGDHSWTGDVAIPANADCGEWTLRQLRVADKANNTAYLTVESPQVGPVSFAVSGGGACDADPPVIDALYVSPATVSNAAASEVTLTVTVHDEGSGVDSLSGRIEGPVAGDGQVPKIYFGSKADAKNPDAPLIAKVPVPQHAGAGVWRVAFVQVMDKAHNTRNYNLGDPALVNASFTVD